MTKVWATYNTRVAEALDKSLKSLGLEYVDLLLVVSKWVSTCHYCMFANEFISTGLFC